MGITLQLSTLAALAPPSSPRAGRGSLLRGSHGLACGPAQPAQRRVVRRKNIAPEPPGPSTSNDRIVPSRRAVQPTRRDTAEGGYCHGDQPPHIHPELRRRSAPRSPGADAPARRAWPGARTARLYPEGVASGDPDANSVILWTRRPYEHGERQLLTVEVAEDAGVPPRRRPRIGARLRRGRLDGAGAGRRAQAGARLLVPLHRRRRQRQPHRPHDHRAARPTIRARSTSPSSAARTSTRASSTPTAG